MDKYERMIIRAQQDWQRRRRSGGCWICPICGQEAKEVHHVAQAAYGDQCIPLCLVCHGRLTERQCTEHPKPVREDGINLEREGRFILGMSDLLESISEEMRKLGESRIAPANEGQRKL